MKIALDAFGSDNAPYPEVEGAVLAVNDDFCEKVYLVGKPDVLKKELGKYFYDKNRIEVVPASQVITMDDKAASAVKSKKDSSLIKTVELQKNKIADAVVSAGNTGAVMAASLFTYGRIKNVLRPALALSFPTVNKPTIILDVGANVDCNVEHLTQFARLGSIYSKFFYNIKSPEVALLNIGEESGKGNDLSKQVYKALTDLPDINFIGNIEGKGILKGEVDVIVCDGFVGNVMLKTVEGVASAMLGMMKEQIKKDWIAKIGALLSFPVFGYLKRKLDHSEHGGALLAGLNGVTVISHGSADGLAIKNSIRFAVKIAKSGFVEHASEIFATKA